MNMQSNRHARSTAATLPILPGDRGKRTDELDLALVFDPATRQYWPVGSR